jgi:hypothetical protein
MAHQPFSFLRHGATRTVLALGLLAVSAAPAAAQLDPLLFLKTLPPNVLFVVDTSQRMAYDADQHFYDPRSYERRGGAWETTLGVNGTIATQFYRRRYRNLQYAAGGGDKFTADVIDVYGDSQASYATFGWQARQAVARRGLSAALGMNTRSARFGLIKTRQQGVTIPTPSDLSKGNDKPVFVSAPGQQSPTDDSTGRWTINRATTTASNSSVTTSGRLVAPDALSANTTVSSALASWLIPAGRDTAVQEDAPVDNMLDDARAEAARLIAADTTGCRNTVVVLVVGGGEGNLSNEDLAAKAGTFLNVSGRRVPIYVVAIAPPAADVAELQAVATRSGGQYFEVSKEMIDAVTPGNAVPEVVRAVNAAVQHSFTKATDFNTAPTAALPYGPSTEFQVTSPVVGTVNLRDASDINGAALPLTYITSPAGVVIPQRANVLVTSGFALPGFEGRLRAFRTYKPVPDSTKPSGYRFDQDGRRLWEARTPSAAARNIHTVLPDGSEVAFDVANAEALRPYLRVADPAALIAFIRSQPLGAVIGSTPAFMDPPSLDPPPAADYVEFAEEHKDRRSMIFVGTNDGMLHAIDGRLGVEAWAFIPFNLLPKLQALRAGQPLDEFRYFVDSSPKIADVKVADEWRTYLIVGQGAGGTFYTTFDVTLDGIGNTVTPTSDSESDVLSYFRRPDSVPLAWSFPRLTSFDHTISTTASPYGDVSAGASAVEKSVGETWSDPAVGQLSNVSGGYEVLVGSGFLARSRELQANRGGIQAGTTFYILDIGTGQVHASQSVGNDNLAENVDNCALAGNCMRLKNALQMDPVATGPADSRFISKVYIGDLDGRVWRFDLTTNVAGDGQIAAVTRLYDALPANPLFASMATVAVGTQQYIFVGTGSELLPSRRWDSTTQTWTALVNHAYSLLVLLDSGASAAKTAEIVLATTDNTGLDEQVTAFPAVAGDIVFFATTTTNVDAPCTPFTATLYAFTFIGGPAYDTNGDGRITTSGGGGGKKGGGGSTTGDSVKVATVANQRATAPFIVDQHLVFGTGNDVQMFGDPQDFNNGVGQVGVRILSWRNMQQ